RLSASAAGREGARALWLDGCASLARRGLYDMTLEALLKPSLRSMAQRAPVVERAALVGLVTGAVRRVDAEQSLEELAGLADAAGADVVVRMLQERPKP